MERFLTSLSVYLWFSVSVAVVEPVSINCTIRDPVEDEPFELICTDISPSQKAEWRRSFQGSSGDGIIASCDDVNICTNNDPRRYSVSRTTSTTSSLTILSVTRGDDSTWTCLSGGQPSSCTLPPSVYHPQLSANCTAELTPEGPVVRCPIKKVYPNPECSWIETFTPTNGTEIQHNTTIPSSSGEALLESVSIFYDNNNRKPYFSATCKLQRNTTYQEGVYSYTAVIFPGSVQYFAQFWGSPTVVAPTTPILEGCSPGFAPPSQEVVCTCKVTDLGWPRGHVMWLDPMGGVIRTVQNHSLQLLIGDVPRESTNKTYTCEVRSTDNFRRTASYAPSLAYGPKAVQVTGPTGFIVGDQQPLTLICTAIEVSPQPVFTWRGLGNDTQMSGVSLGEDPKSYRESISFVPTEDQDGHIVTCFVGNTQFDEPSTPNASYAIRLIRKENNQSNQSGESSSLVTILSALLGAAGFLCIIFLVCTVCLCLRRKKKDPPQKEDSTVKKTALTEEEAHIESAANTAAKGPRAELALPPTPCSGQIKKKSQLLTERVTNRNSLHHYSSLSKTDAGEYVEMDPKVNDRSHANTSTDSQQPCTPPQEDTPGQSSSKQRPDNDSPPDDPAPPPPADTPLKPPAKHSPAVGAEYLTPLPNVPPSVDGSQADSRDATSDPQDKSSEKAPSSPELPPLPLLPVTLPTTPRTIPEEGQN